MRAKNFIIKIKSVSDYLDKFEKDYNDLKKGKAIKRIISKNTIYFPDLATVTKILSEKRLELIATIIAKKPRSINELAKMVGRDQPNVHKDVHYLSSLGIIGLEESKSKRTKATIYKPCFKYSGFQIDLAA